MKFVWRLLGRVFEGEHSVEAISIFIKRIPKDEMLRLVLPGCFFLYVGFLLWMMDDVFFLKEL